jgi:hypothetical protein
MTDIYDESYYTKITKNAAQCLQCFDVIESRHRHDYVTCSCGSISVDGGLAYLRASFKDQSLFSSKVETRRYTEQELLEKLTTAYSDAKMYSYSASYSDKNINSIKYYLNLWYK